MRKYFMKQGNKMMDNIVKGPDLRSIEDNQQFGLFATQVPQFVDDG